MEQFFIAFRIAKQGIRIQAVILLCLLLSGVTSMYAQPCLPDGIIFNSQAQLDSFQVLYPECTEIEGNVQIHQNSDIHDLSPLSNITTIGGYLWVSSSYLNSLHGFHNLESVGSWLSLFRGNYNKLNELSNLRSIQGGLQVVSCNELEDFSELDSLQYLGGGIQIIGNDNFANLYGLQGIDSIHEGLDIRDNPSLESLEGLNNLVYVGGDLQLIDNAGLNDLSSLGNLIKIDGKLEVNNCDSLLDLKGMNKLQSIGEELYIKNCFNILNLVGLEELVYVGDEVYLWQNHSLENLDGLENLTEIGSDLTIVINNSLVNLNGLHGLVDMGPKLMIFSNDLLSDITGLENLGENQLEELIIASNPSLSDCSIQSICSFLESGSEALIAGNMTGCTSEEEVEEGCETGLGEPGLSKFIAIYPNPFTTATAIEFTLDKKSKIQILIYNTIGEIVFQFEGQYERGSHKVSWSPSHLPAGLYYAVLKSEEGVSVVKMVKQ